METDESCSVMASSGVGGSSTGGMGGTGGGDIASRKVEVDDSVLSLLVASNEKPLGGGMEGGTGGLGGGGDNGLRNPVDEARVNPPEEVRLMATGEERRSSCEAGEGDTSSLSLKDTAITDTVEHFPERRPVLDGSFGWRRLPLGVPNVMDLFPTSVPSLEDLCIPAAISALSSLVDSEDDTSVMDTVLFRAFSGIATMSPTTPDLGRFFPTICTKNRKYLTNSPL
ncbi:unnamed protein product [Ixodes hexagonus]